tara:strand:- start:6018 stop:6533 length:516 start_codon:yes stop_codon:yes gene_type:complete
MSIDLELDKLADDLDSAVKRATTLVDKKQNEAVIASALGLVLSGPFLVKIIGNTINRAKKLISKSGDSSKIGDAIVSFSEKMHHVVERPFKLLAKTFTKDPTKQALFAQAMMASIIAILLVDSGLSFAKYVQKMNIKSSLIYGAKSAIKSTELRGMIAELGIFIRSLLTKI